MILKFYVFLHLYQLCHWKILHNKYLLYTTADLRDDDPSKCGVTSFYNHYIVVNLHFKIRKGRSVLS